MEYCIKIRRITQPEAIWFFEWWWDHFEPGHPDVDQVTDFMLDAMSGRLVIRIVDDRGLALLTRMLWG